MHADAYGYFERPFACLAHRGGYVDEADAARENTLYAFSRAVHELGYHYLETDVHATLDAQLVAFHDRRLDRVTNARGGISELTLAQVKRAKVAGIDEVPTLDELFEALPQAQFNIDIKQANAIEPLVSCIRAHHAESRVLVTSFGASRLTKFRQLAGRTVATGASIPEVAWAAFVPYLPRLAPTPAAAFQIPARQSLDGCLLPVLTRQLLASAHANGRRVHAWTVNDEAEMHHLIGLGVDGIVSDNLCVLKAVAIEHGLWA